MRKTMLCLALLCSSACGADEALPTLQSNMTSQDAERWTVSDDPAIFGDALERTLGRLPTSGRARQMPWVGSYWPMYLDSINFHWAGPSSESASSKYQRAFGGGNVENVVSATYGIDATRGSACWGHGSCGGGKMCALRPGQSVGRCVPLWWGMCQGWASASILHPEPQRPVIHNGVRFEIADIKALLTLAYSDPKLKIVSLRCEESASSLRRDDSGRPTSTNCRDSNPGTFHLLLANYLGIQGRSFVEDRSMDIDVWNQPLVGYKILKMHRVNLNSALAALGVSSADYVYNRAAASLVYVMTDVSFIRETSPDTDGYLAPQIDKYTYVDRYEYILELDASGHIIGGEWVGPSKHNHPDFLWLPTGPGDAPLAQGSVEARNVMMLGRTSLGS